MELRYLASANGQYLVALIAFLACGSLLGFLPHNYPAAKAFLGDSGSHLTGYLLAVLAILPHFHTSQNPHPLAVLKPLLVLGVPLADLAQVVIYRWRIGQPVYVGDNNHLSHRLVRCRPVPASRRRLALAVRGRARRHRLFPVSIREDFGLPGPCYSS